MERLLEIFLYFDDTVKAYIWQTTDVPHQMLNKTTGEIRQAKDISALYHVLYMQKRSPDVTVHILRKIP